MGWDAVAAEWWKLRSVRSTYWTLAATAVFLVFVLVLAVQMAQIWDGLSAERRADFELRPLQLLGGWGRRSAWPSSVCCPSRPSTAPAWSARPSP